jgi:hypothetical protein
MSHRRVSISALLVGNAESPRKAAEIAEKMEGCPYVSVYIASERLVVGVFALPATKRWWIEYPAEHPELLGLERAAVFVTKSVETSSPWTKGKVESSLPAGPCGSVCGRCSQYGDTCDGCPATTWYMGEQHSECQYRTDGGSHSG